MWAGGGGTSKHGPRRCGALGRRHGAWQSGKPIHAEAEAEAAAAISFSRGKGPWMARLGDLPYFGGATSQRPAGGRRAWARGQLASWQQAGAFDGRPPITPVLLHVDNNERRRRRNQPPRPRFPSSSVDTHGGCGRKLVYATGASASEVAPRKQTLRCPIPDVSCFVVVLVRGMPLTDTNPHWAAGPDAGWPGQWGPARHGGHAGPRLMVGQGEVWQMALPLSASGVCTDPPHNHA